MGQKVQVLGAVAHDPEFVVLDEPFSGLDPVNQQVLEELIRDLARRARPCCSRRTSCSTPSGSATACC